MARKYNGNWKKAQAAGSRNGCRKSDAKRSTPKRTGERMRQERQDPIKVMDRAARVDVMVFPSSTVIQFSDDKRKKYAEYRVGKGWGDGKGN